MKRKIICIYAAFFFMLCGMPAESFRVNKVHSVIVPQFEVEEAPIVSLGVSDAIALEIPADRLFLQAVSLEIKVPSVVAAYRHSVAYSVYRNISPDPKAGRIDYTAERLCLETFPSRLSYNLQIPLAENHSMKSTPYTSVLADVIGKSENVILFRLQPVMKGVPGELFTSEFSVQVKPIFTGDGLLVLDVLYPPNSVQPEIREKMPYSIFIDEKPALYTDRGILLPAGNHHLSLVSELYRSEVRTFTIEQAQTVRLSIQLQDIAPLLMVIAPENAVVFLDDNELLLPIKEPFVVSAGEHVLKVIVGGYETVRKVFIQNGKTYTMSVALELEIEEE
ncbi:MAG: hypothetical protein NC176_03840 [Treponema brennaborense]|nr:hypothetical protein [Prevotella sp.]MCM1407601.1 hypothetical protein [Treponema brennaborense]